MGHKIFLPALCLISNVAVADCYYKSSSIAELNLKIEARDAVHKIIIDNGNNHKTCDVTFVAKIKNEWYPVESRAEGYGTDEQICDQALDSGQATILHRVGGARVTITESQTCTDMPIHVNRKVKVNELVSISEVTPHPFWRQIVKSRDGFEYARFIERIDGSTERREGVLQRINETTWQVVDKF